MNNFPRAKVARFFMISLTNGSSPLSAIFALKLTLFALRKPHPGLFRGSLSAGLGLGLSLITSTLSAEVQLIDGIAAVVNEDIILLSELRSEVKVIHQRLAASGQAPTREEILPQVLDKLIVDKLQLTIGERANVTIDDDELNQAIARIAKNQNISKIELIAQVQKQGMSYGQFRRQISNEMIISQVQRAMVNRRIHVSDQQIDNFLVSDQGKLLGSPDVNVGHILLPLSPAASPAEVEKVFEKARIMRVQLENGEEFRQLAVLHSAGQNALKGGDLGWRKASQLPAPFTEALTLMSPGEFSDPIRSDAGLHLLILYERRGAEVQIIQQSLVRHILLTPSEIMSDEQTQTLAIELLARINSGEHFAELAKKYSDDTGTALKGGELGWSRPGQFVDEFQAAMDATETGSISEPFQSQFGWHILHIMERRNQDFSDEIRRNQAGNFLRQSKFEEELQVWLQEIRDEAFIDIRI